MMRFKASTQYTDWEGSAAADDSDQTGIEDYLREHALMTKQDRLLSISIYAGENHHGAVNHVSVGVSILEGHRSMEEVKKAIAGENKPIPVRTERLELSLDEFVGMFKRFSVVLTDSGLDLHDREYRETNS